MKVKKSRAFAGIAGIAVVAVTVLAAVGMSSAVTPDTQVGPARIRAVISWTPLALGRDGQQFPADVNELRFDQRGGGLDAIIGTGGLPEAVNTAALGAYLTSWSATHPQPAGWLTLTSDWFDREYTTDRAGSVTGSGPEYLARSWTVRQVVVNPVAAVPECPTAGLLDCGGTGSGGTAPAPVAAPKVAGTTCPVGHMCGAGGTVGGAVGGTGSVGTGTGGTGTAPVAAPKVAGEVSACLLDFPTWGLLDCAVNRNAGVVAPAIVKPQAVGKGTVIESGSFSSSSN